MALQPIQTDPNNIPPSALPASITPIFSSFASASSSAIPSSDPITPTKPSHGSAWSNAVGPSPTGIGAIFDETPPHMKIHLGGTSTATGGAGPSDQRPDLRTPSKRASSKRRGAARGMMFSFGDPGSDSSCSESDERVSRRIGFPTVPDSETRQEGDWNGGISSALGDNRFKRPRSIELRTPQAGTSGRVGDTRPHRDGADIGGDLPTPMGSPSRSAWNPFSTERNQAGTTTTSWQGPPIGLNTPPQSSPVAKRQRRMSAAGRVPTFVVLASLEVPNGSSASAAATRHALASIIPTTELTQIAQHVTRASRVRTRRVGVQTRTQPRLAPPQESPTTQNLRRRRQRAAWEGILGGMGPGSGIDSGASSETAVDYTLEDAVEAMRAKSDSGSSGVNVDAVAPIALAVQGSDAIGHDVGAINANDSDSMDVDLFVQEDSDDMAEVAGSSSRASREQATPIEPTSRERVTPSASIPFHPGPSTTVENQVVASAEQISHAAWNKKRGFDQSCLFIHQSTVHSAMELKQGMLLGGRRAGPVYGGGKASQRYQVNTIPHYLSQFTSHLVLADHRVTPNENHRPHRSGGRDWSAAYACAYSHAAKSGEGPSLLALGTESGAVRIFDSNMSAEEEQATAPPTSKYYCPHDNAIFDLKWSPDDAMILTCCADQTSAVYSSDGATRVALLRGHTSSVKTGTWTDSNVLSTSGRDGNILIYDLRTRGSATATEQAQAGVSRCKRARPELAEDGELYPVMTVRNAHGNTGKAGPSSAMARSAVRSVTSLIALKTMQHTLASGGNADGVIKLWDLRAVYGGSSHGRKQYISEPVAETVDRRVDVGVDRRSRGICSLVEGDGMLFSLGYGTSIQTHSLASLEMPLPMTYTHPSMRNSSFYVKLAISPCARYLACGSTTGAVYTWEVGQQSRKRMTFDEQLEGVFTDQVIGTEMHWNGHRREVGAVDWGKDQIVSCSDDYTNRIWRPNRVATEYIRREPANAAWHWAGISPDT